jgi:hypothetical protein
VEPARSTLQIRRSALSAVVFGTMSMVFLTGCALTETGTGTVTSDVSDDATYGNGQRKLAEGPDGSMYFIYAAPMDGTNAVVVSRSEDAGSTWVPDAVLSRSGIPARLGSLAFDAAGTLHATWVDYETVGHVWYASRSDDTWTESVKISPGPFYAGFPVVAAGRDSVHVLWYGAPPDDTYRHGSRYEIRDTSLTPQGWTEPVLVSTDSSDSLNPSAVADRQGNVHSAWYQLDDSIYRANYAVWDADRWAEPEAVSPSSSGAARVSIDVGPDGVIHLIWLQTQDGVAQVAYSRLAGGSWSDTEFLTQGPAADPVLATTTQGDVIAAWSADNEIVMRRWEAGRWGSPQAVGLGALPTLAAGERVFIGWTRSVDGGYELAIADLSETGGAFSLPLAISAVVLAGFLVGVFVALMTRRRSRPVPE